MGKRSVLGDAAQVTRCFHYCCKLHSISQACNKSICFSILPLTWGSQSVLCVWWLWVSNCRSAPPHCSLVDKNTYVTQCNNMSHNRKENAHARVFATLTLSERHDVPHLSVLAQQNGQLLDSAVLFSASKTIFGLFKCHVGTIYFLEQQRSGVQLFTFSSFDANKDSIPTFSLWYSWSNKVKGGIKAGIQTGSRLMSCEFKPWWEPVMQCLAMDMAAMLIWINRQN